jgi:hypothetical protein
MGLMERLRLSQHRVYPTAASGQPGGDREIIALESEARVDGVNGALTQR